jgi:peptide/nickel transport system permease protein
MSAVAGGAELTSPTGDSAGRARPAIRALARQLLNRLVQLVVLLFVISSVLFLLLRLTGDPAVTIAGENATPDTLGAVRVQYGLNGSQLHQYLTFLGNLLHLDFGSSLSTGQDALGMVMAQLPATLRLAIAAIVLNAVISVPLGAWLGSRRRGIARESASFLVTVAQGIPGYVVGLLLIQVFAVWLHVLPSVSDGGFSSLVLPALTLASFQVPKMVRVTAASVAEAGRADYILTATANGAPPGVVVLRHALPNALLAVTAMLGAQFAFLLSGTLITEYLFNWPGLGLLMVNSVQRLDFPVVQAAVFVTAVMVFVVNVVMDIVFELADPRLRRSGT